MRIAVDFDMTVCISEYKDGKTTILSDNEGAVDVLKALDKKGHQLFLWTSRNKKSIPEAIQWFKDNGIKLYAVNSDPDKQTDSAKIRCDLYIDDKALNAPLKYKQKLNKEGQFEDTGEGFIDWVRISYELKRLKYL